MRNITLLHSALLLLCAGAAMRAQTDRAPSVTTLPLNGIERLTGPYRPRVVSPVDYEDSSRLHGLLRAGNLYLSQADALALAIENNLDVELQRFLTPMANTELLRAKGGGLLRGVPYTLAEAPVGVGGPYSPLNNSAAGRGTTGTTVPTNPSELGVLGSPQANLSILGNTPLSNGTGVPAYDPSLVSQLGWYHQTTPQSSVSVTGTSTLVSNTTVGNAGYVQGFSTGTQVNAGFNNSYQWLNSFRSSYNPFSTSSLGVTVTQPLLRGFGKDLNRRFIRIAANEQKISSLLFRQQLIATVYGVTRLYTDLVALYEDVKVKQETLGLAEKLLADTSAQVEEGTLAPVEKTRAKAQVASSRQDLVNALGLLEEQEAVLKNVLTRGSMADPAFRTARIIPTDTITVPAADEVPPVDDLLAQALSSRPDLGQARLQVDNSQISLKGSRDAMRPQLDLVGIAQNNGLAGDAVSGALGLDPRYVGGYGTALEQVFLRNNPTYGVGIQLALPLRNRVAQADAARDEIQVRQSEVRLRQLQNLARLEVEDAVIAMRRARASYEAAVQTRELQEESLKAEQAKFEVGASTSYFVIQYESLVAQAKSTEVAARSSYVKAKAALQRATGTILEANHISFDAAYQGTM
jgi:outer membrane protein